MPSGPGSLSTTGEPTRRYPTAKPPTTGTCTHTKSKPRHGIHTAKSQRLPVRQGRPDCSRPRRRPRPRPRRTRCAMERLAGTPAGSPQTGSTLQRTSTWKQRELKPLTQPATSTTRSPWITPEDSSFPPAKCVESTTASATETEYGNRPTSHAGKRAGNNRRTARQLRHTNDRPPSRCRNSRRHHVTHEPGLGTNNTRKTPNEPSFLPLPPQVRHHSHRNG